MDPRSLRVAPGGAAALGRRDPADRLELAGKEEARAELGRLVERLALLQGRLWAEGRRSLLLVLQGLDTSGKDGAIRRVFTGVNPQGCRVHSFKAPAGAELDHDYLWRVHARCPARGHIGVFNRSHYEDVTTTLVLGTIDTARRDRRIEHVRTFERALVDEGTEVVKVFLQISREEQRTRLAARLADPEKRWKFRHDDLETRKHWDEHAAAWEHAITETSTKRAPWYVVPADHKWVRDVAIATLLVETLSRMDPHPPPPDPALDGIRVE